MANSYTIFSGLECSPSTLYNEAWALVFYGRRAASWSSKTELFRPPLDDDGLRYLCASHLTGSTILTLHDGVFGRLFLETNVYSSLVSRLPEARPLRMHNLEYPGPVQGSSHATIDQPERITHLSCMLRFFNLQEAAHFRQPPIGPINTSISGGRAPSTVQRKFSAPRQRGGSISTASKFLGLVPVLWVAGRGSRMHSESPDQIKRGSIPYVGQSRQPISTALMRISGFFFQSTLLEGRQQ